MLTNLNGKQDNGRTETLWTYDNPRDSFPMQLQGAAAGGGPDNAIAVHLKVNFKLDVAAVATSNVDAVDTNDYWPEATASGGGGAGVSWSFDGSGKINANANFTWTPTTAKVSPPSTWKATPGPGQPDEGDDHQHAG
jgi:hypothetical protein